MRDFSQFVGGQCEIQSHLSRQHDRQTCRGDIRLIKVTDTELDIHFDWLAHWSLKDGFWTMDKSASEHLRTKIVVDNPSKIHIIGPNEYGMLAIDVHTLDQLVLLYPKGYRRDGASDYLDRAQVEERQNRRAELDAMLRASVYR